MNKIKVCVVVRNSVWHDPRVIKQLKEYRKYGCELYVVGEEDNRYVEEEVSKILANVHIIKFKSVPPKKKNRIRSFINVLSFYKNFSNAISLCKPDIIHANDLDALIGAYFASIKCRCKVVYDTHEVFVENFGQSSAVLQKFCWSTIERWIIRRVDLVVCVSNATAEFLSKKYNISKPLVVTNCAMRQSLDQISAVKSEKFEVLNHGQFYEARGYDLMVSAAALTEVSDINFVLRGFGKMESELRTEVKKKQLYNVLFAPPVKTTELIAIARRSHVGVAVTVPINLNFKLSVSNKIFEYAAAGLPVIMSDIPEHRYLNEKYNFGIILHENTAECLRDAVMTLYENEELYKLYAANAKLLSDELNWETEFAKLIAKEKQIIS